MWILITFTIIVIVIIIIIIIVINNIIIIIIIVFISISIIIFIIIPIIIDDDGLMGRVKALHWFESNCISDPESIKSYIDSFRYGAPPHAGGGIGKWLTLRDIYLFLIEKESLS